MFILFYFVPFQRCMKTCFLLLVRFYLRVDDVIVRVIDSRFYGEPDWDFVVWEYTKRESSFAELRAKVKYQLTFNQYMKLFYITIVKLRFEIQVGQFLPFGKKTEQALQTFV